MVGVLSILERTLLAGSHAREGPLLAAVSGAGQFVFDGLKLYSKASKQGSSLSVVGVLLLGYSAVFVVAVMVVISSLEVVCMSVCSVLVVSILADGMCVLLSAFVGSTSKSVWVSSGLIRSIRVSVVAGILADLILVSVSSVITGIDSSEYSARTNISLASIVSIGVCVVLIESNKSPVDYAESESELIAGSMSELGGPAFSLAVVTEYSEVVTGIITLAIVGICASVVSAISIVSLVVYTYYGRVLLVRVSVYSILATLIGHLS